jgi:Fic family protein
MTLQLKIIPTDLLTSYTSEFDSSLEAEFDKLVDNDLSVDNFSFYTSVSAVFSSKIEGEEIEFDSFVKHKRFGINYLPDYTQKIDDLYSAYTFAQSNTINDTTIKQAHSEITKHILPKNQQGKIRIGNMFVITNDGKIEYVAAEPGKVKTELDKLTSDINTLLDFTLSFKESFFYASFIHLLFVKIHPFDDGNGRTARLLEKWFLAEKLGKKAWFIQSEKNYYDNHQAYYSNIRKLGLEYTELDYSNASSFLNMLPNSLKIKN